MCHCGKPEAFADCCGRFIEQDETPETPEELMRSRYSAFVLKNYGYLHETQDPQTRSVTDSEANNDFANSVQFTGLQVLASSQNGNKGSVEFIASYKNLQNGESLKHHELSQFRKQAGIWYYRQGRMQSETK